MLPDADVEMRMHDYTKSISPRQLLGRKRIVARPGQSFAVVEDSNIAHGRFNFQPSRSSLALHPSSTAASIPRTPEIGTAQRQSSQRDIWNTDR